MTKQITDEEIINIALGIDSDVDEIRIEDGGNVRVFDVRRAFRGRLPESIFELHTRDGTIFAGVLIAHDKTSFRLRQDDGQILILRKDAVVAIRRPRKKES